MQNALEYWGDVERLPTLVKSMHQKKPMQVVVSLNYCSQNGGNLYRAPYYNGNSNVGPRIIGNLDQSPGEVWQVRESQNSRAFEGGGGQVPLGLGVLCPHIREVSECHLHPGPPEVAHPAPEGPLVGFPVPRARRKLVACCPAPKAYRWRL